WLLWESIALRHGAPHHPPKDLESALNETLLASKCCRLETTGSSFVVSLREFPQCRGEGETVGAALQQLRYGLARMRDTRVATSLDNVLARERANEAIRPYRLSRTRSLE